MKTIIRILLASVLFIGCKKDKGVSADSKLIGLWMVVQRGYDTNGDNKIDETENDPYINTVLEKRIFAANHKAYDSVDYAVGYYMELGKYNWGYDSGDSILHLDFLDYSDKVINSFQSVVHSLTDKQLILSKSGDTAHPYRYFRVYEKR